MERFGNREFESATEHAVQEAWNEWERLINENPALDLYAPFTNAIVARDALAKASGLLQRNPDLLEHLAQASAADGEGRLTMLVIPRYPLVIVDSGTTITVVAPTLSCTWKAIDKAFSENPEKQWDLLVSHGSLDGAVLQHALTKPEEPFNYDHSMEPADYIELAVNVFHNEPFRLRFAKGDPTFTPL